MKRYFFALFTTCFLASQIAAQDESLPTGSTSYLGASFQVYPAGFIPTANYENFLSEKASLVFRLGANITDRQDFSDVNDTEEGEGFGGSIGYRKHYHFNKGKIIVGLNTDIWSLQIDWTDANNPVGSQSGTTDIVVLQPWLEGGYFFKLNNGASQLGISAGIGREFNIATSGDEVAQGFIGSLILQYQFRTSK